jgi:hypothetical protein
VKGKWTERELGFIRRDRPEQAHSLCHRRCQMTSGNCSTIQCSGFDLARCLYSSQASLSIMLRIIPPQSECPNAILRLDIIKEHKIMYVVFSYNHVQFVPFAARTGTPVVIAMTDAY